MFKGLADFDFPEGAHAFTVELIDSIKKIELSKTGKNKDLPFDRIRKQNPIFDA